MSNETVQHSLVIGDAEYKEFPLSEDDKKEFATGVSRIDESAKEYLERLYNDVTTPFRVLVSHNK